MFWGCCVWVLVLSVLMCFPCVFGWFGYFGVWVFWDHSGVLNVLDFVGFRCFGCSCRGVFASAVVALVWVFGLVVGRLLLVVL